MSDFQQVLKRLVEDPHFRDAVANDSSRLQKDFKNLDTKDVLLLMQVWHASGDPKAASMLSMCHCCCCAHAEPPR
jgi:hypothetical protein